MYAKTQANPHVIHRAAVVVALAALFVLSPAIFAPLVMVIGDQILVGAIALFVFLAGDLALEPWYARRATAHNARAWAACAAGFVTAAIVVTQFVGM